jgi:NADPH:quinone reductase-like Zn-dependent oxidoreductase
MTANGPKMRAYQLDRLGSLDGLVLVERDIPSPGAGEVLVQVRASSLNFRDMMILNGGYPMPIPPGRVPLSDGAGEVIAVGADVTRFKTGDRVINSFFPNWFGGAFNAMPEQYVVDHDGWLTEYKVVSAEAVVSMPEYLTFEEAATLPCVAVTAWSALSGVRAGETVLTQGAGGVSLFAVQLAKALGARVIATTSNPENSARLRELGADEVIDSRDSRDWGDLVRALTGGRGVDRVVEVGGPGTLGAVGQGHRLWRSGIPGGCSGGRGGRPRLHDHVPEPGKVPADRDWQPARSRGPVPSDRTAWDPAGHRQRVFLRRRQGRLEPLRGAQSHRQGRDPSLSRR